MELVTPDFGLLFWQILTFAVVLFVLSKFAWKPIISGLKEREEGIEKAISEARLAREEIAGLKSDNEKLLAEARRERDKMLQEAQHTANHLVEEAKERASKETNAMIAAAREEIEISKEAAIAELKNYLAETSLDIATKILQKNLASDQAQQQLVKELIESSVSKN